MPKSNPKHDTHDQVRLIPLKAFTDSGSLIAVEEQTGCPFAIARIFFVYGAELGALRGDHAHIACKQALICVHGVCKVTYTDGTSEQTVMLDTPQKMLYVPELIWCSESYETNDTVLLVLADQPYDATDYIRDYDQFLSRRGRSK